MTVVCCFGGVNNSAQASSSTKKKTPTSDNYARSTVKTMKDSTTSVPENGAPPRNEMKRRPNRESIITVGATKWLELKTIDYTDEEGISRKWDVATRKTKQENVPDAVVIIPIMTSKKTNVVETMLVEQYRPPIEDYALEFPAGLVDKGESPQSAAIRELWEETGYVGTIDTTFQPDDLCMSPGFSDETIQIIIVKVDLDDPKNNKPDQHLDDGEAVTIKRIPLTTALRETLGKSSSMPISLLYSFAIGLEIGAKHFKADA